MWRTWTNPSSSWVYGGVRSPFRPGCVAQRGRRCHRGRALPRAESGSLWLRSLWGAGGLRAGDLCEELAGGRPAEPTSCSLPPRRTVAVRAAALLEGRSVASGPRTTPRWAGGRRAAAFLPREGRRWSIGPRLPALLAPPCGGRCPWGGWGGCPLRGCPERAGSRGGRMCPRGRSVSSQLDCAVAVAVNDSYLYYKQHSPRKSCWSTLVVTSAVFLMYDSACLCSPMLYLEGCGCFLCSILLCIGVEITELFSST